MGAAAALALGAVFASVPASAAESTTPAAAGGSASPSVSSPASVSSLASEDSGAAGSADQAAPVAWPTGGNVAEEGLAEVVQRDLGMTLAEFNAAGAQGKRAADAAVTLRELPGFVAMRLHRGKILVEGTGTEFETTIGALNAADAAGRNEFVLVPPGTDLGTTAPESTRPANAAEALSAQATASQAASGQVASGQSASAQGTDAARSLQATSAEQLYQAYVRDVGPAGLQAVAAADGKFIIRTGGVNAPETDIAAGAETDAGAAAKEDRMSAAGQAAPTGEPAAAGVSGVSGEPRMSPSEFVARYANVVLEKGGPIASEEDFLGGQGYRIDGGIVCSAGFSAFSPDGKPLVLTAGHCADDGAARLAEVTLPAGEPAGGYLAESGVTGELGTFGFSQFGGPGNARITDPANPGAPGTDIAAIESIRSGLDLLPAATRWEDPADLGAGSVPIVGTAPPLEGQAVCRSGRTEGWSCGTVDEVGIYVVGGSSGDPDDLRSFRGFLSTSVQSSGGDSGGPWISGNYAVGTHSAGNARSSAENFAVAATLEQSLAVLPGVQLRLFLNKPVLTGPLPAGPIVAGQRIEGRGAAAPATDVPAGTQVRITLPGREPLDVAVDAQGNWSFTAPASATEFTAQAINGFSRSGLSTFSTVPKPAAPEPGTPSKPPGAVQPAVPSKPAAAHGDQSAVLTPAPEPSVVAAMPDDRLARAAIGDGAVTAGLADTGASGLLVAGGVAGAALVLGGVLLVALRRRGRR
ncbi:peptidase [Arthrobacter sp. ISL-5]|nr:peptidase [Arthrobacter sp. ISL-5]